MIKLTPEHVGTRVLRSDGEVDLLAHYEPPNEYITRGSWAGLRGFYNDDGCGEGQAPDVTLLLDAPNPLDVEVPEWCEFVSAWKGKYYHINMRTADYCKLFQPDGWLWQPGPGQLPPREGS